MRTQRSVARARLDEKLAGFPQALLEAPQAGWVATIRDALGMSVRELGRRMGTSGQRASKLELDESSGVIQVSSLRRAAEAMNCRLVYVLIPNEPLEAMVRKQARRRASSVMSPILHSTRIEDQDVGDRVIEQQLEDLAGELVDRRGLWSDAE